MSKKMYYTAKEVEEIMQNARNKEGFTGKTEQASIKTMIQTAKQNGRIGDKILLVVNPMYIHIPTWQRRLNISRSLQIGNSYNKAKWDVPKVLYSKKENKLYCVDGQHRVFGAFSAGIEGCVVEILEMEINEAIELFLNQAKDRGVMSPFDMYKASIEAGKPEYLELRKICHQNNIEIKGDDESLPNPIGCITSISDGIRLVGKDNLLDTILKLINKLQWNGSGDMNVQQRAYTAKYLRVLEKLYAYYGNTIEGILLRNCKGAEYFNNKLAAMWQDTLFDYLSDIIGRDLQMEEVKSYNGKVIRKVRKIS